MQLLIEPDGPVVRVTLNRPEVRNAFNEELIAELTAWAESVTAGGPARVAVLSGAGKMFCAGADLAWMSKMVAYTRDENVRDARAMARMFEALDRCRFRSSAASMAPRSAAGVGLAAVCDIVVAAEDAVVRVHRGEARHPAGGDLAVRAREDRPVGGARAVPDRGAIRGRARQGDRPGPCGRRPTRISIGSSRSTSNDLVTSAPEAVAAAKQLIAEVATRDATGATEYTIEAIAERRVSPEGQEGMTAFLAKRPPTWISGGSS